jgi:rSAM/selenodomain-associated transferase 1
MAFDALVLFAKVPKPGRVKTRLGAVIGKPQAARLYGLFLKYLSWRLRKLPPELKLFIAVDPPGGQRQIPAFFPYSRKPLVFAQRGRDLGVRMLNASREAKKRGAQKVLLIGSDCLELPVSYLTKGLKLLGNKDLVLGRALDGGYYLVGWKRVIPGCFKGVAWGKSQVLGQTVRNARKAGLSVGFLPALSDVDREEDLPRLLRKLDSQNPIARFLKKALRAGHQSSDALTE